ncbi:DUF3526 domain-containing protein [Roseivirga pacifica]|uniref:DUF3526 domain-containing protein n=1 Tax=Roseivirga pacifica TaxID=1267423 RepID=UPI003BA93787
MITQNIQHEIRLLSRNHWFVSLTAVLLLLCLYAGHNGLQHFESRQADLNQALADQEEKIQNVTSVAVAVNNGEEPSNAYRLSPMNIAMSTGELATMPPSNMSKLAIGQSDLFTHQVKISSRDDQATLSFNELNNPVQLLFGNFDIAFVLAYLVPLIIIAFTYNLRSQELESGRLKLLASNPMKTNIWLLQRFVIRYFSILIILSIAILLTVLWVGIPFNFALLTLLLLTFAYVAFWFGLSFLVNIIGASSGKNAVSLLSLWIVLVLILPTVINQAANTIYPMPSRVALLNEIRETKKSLSEKQDQVLDEYLRNHPELIRDEGQNAYGYWQGYFASQELMEEELAPLIEKFDNQLAKQQSWVDSWRFLSPVVLFQDAATQLAGTSSKNHKDFQNDVKDFGLTWRAHFMPYVFKNNMLKLSDLEELPAFSYQPKPGYTAAYINLGVLLLLSGLFAIRGLKLEGKRQLLQVG